MTSAMLIPNPTDSKVDTVEPNLENSLNEKQLRHNKARGVVVDNIFWAACGGIFPLPLLDAGFISAVQVKMVYDLSVVYQVPFTPRRTQALIFALAGGGSSWLLASVTKSIPVLGSIPAMVSIGLYGGASTYAIGQIFLEHFEKGGNFDNFEADKFREDYALKYKEGEILAKKILAN